MRFGEPYERCHYCRKWVKLSGFFRGMHLCLSPENRARQDAYDVSIRRSQAAQIAAQKALSRKQRFTKS